MIKLRINKTIKFGFIPTLNGEAVDLSAHTLKVQVIPPTKKKITVTHTVDNGKVYFSYTPLIPGPHLITIILDEGTVNQLFCDVKKLQAVKYSFNEDVDDDEVITDDFYAYFSKVTTLNYSDYYTKSEVDSAISYNVKLNVDSELTYYALKTDIPSLNGYVTSEILSAQAYLTSVTFPNYNNTYAAKEHTHDQYLTSVTFPDYSNTYVLKTQLPDYSSTYQAIGNYATVNDIVNAGYITSTPDYSNTYAAKEHTHSQYLTEHQSLSEYAKLSDIPDVSDFLTEVSFPNYNNTYAAKEHTHDQYLTSVSFPDYSNTYILKNQLPDYSSTYQAVGNYVTANDMVNAGYITSTPDYSNTYAAKEHTHDQYLTSVTFPDYSSTYQAVGNYVTVNDMVNAGYITSTPDYSNTYAAKEHTHDQYLTSVTFPDYSSTYQAKGEYYTKSEVDEKVSGIDLTVFRMVNELPTENIETEKIYLVPSPVAGENNIYIEYSYVDGAWEKIGEYKSAVDLNPYVTKEYLISQSYLTSESDPIFSISAASTIKLTDIDNWNATYNDIKNVYTKSEIDGKGFLTTTPDYSNTYAAKEHTHSQYLTQHQDISGKQDVISDLETIRSGAALGATALQSVTFPDYSFTYQAVGNYVTVNDMVNAGYITSTPDYSNTYAAKEHTHSQYLIEHQDISGKQDVISDLETIRSGAALGATSLQSVTFPNYSNTYQAVGNYVTVNDMFNAGYITSTPDYSNTYQAKGDYITPEILSAQAYLTQHQDISGKQDVISDLETIRSGAALGATALQSVTFPDYSFTYQAVGNYVTVNDMVNAGYITSTPDYSNTYQAKGDYITPEILSAQAYLTQHQDISGLATKSELNTLISGNASDAIDNFQEIEKFLEGFKDSDTETLKNKLDAKQDVISDLETIRSGAALGATALQSVTFPNYSNTYQAKGNYVTVNELVNAGYITSTPDYSNIYAAKEHTHSQYLTSVTHPDYSNTYAAKEHTHSQYLTSVTHPDYSNTYAAKEHTHSQYLIEHQDISGKQDVISDLETIRSGAALGATSLQSVTFPNYSNTYQAKGNYVTVNELVNAGYITSTPDYSNTYAAKEHTHSQYLTSVTHPDYSNTYAAKEHTHSQYLTEHQDISNVVQNVYGVGKYNHPYASYILLGHGGASFITYDKSGDHNCEIELNIAAINANDEDNWSVVNIYSYDHANYEKSHIKMNGSAISFIVTDYYHNTSSNVKLGLNGFTYNSKQLATEEYVNTYVNNKLGDIETLLANI